jgi:hypothetical protein
VLFLILSEPQESTTQNFDAEDANFREALGPDPSGVLFRSFAESAIISH